MVNDAVTHISNSNLPFGGVGPSGIGSYHGEAGFKSFTHYKGIVEKSTLLELPLKYYPHTNGKLWWIKRFFRF
jgi:aldehyde dehydrogenase (NAD+)